MSSTHLSLRRAVGALAAGAVASMIAFTAVPVAADPSAEPAPGAQTPQPLLTPQQSPSSDAARQTVVRGDSTAVTMHADALPASGSGSFTLPVGDGEQAVTVTDVEQRPAYTAWTGTLDDVPDSSFALVEADGVYRGSLLAPDVNYALTQSEDGSHWWTEVAPQPATSGADAAPAPRPANAAPEAAPAGTKRARIGVMFGFTRRALGDAGSRAQLKANAALVITQTNESLATSGMAKIRVRFRGLVRAKGRESRNAVKDAFRVSRPRDGHFDNLQRVRRRHHGDIVHLFTAGSEFRVCGGGLIPIRPRWANPRAGASVSYVSCMPYLVATHEIGHNLGGDHNAYPGVSHHSRVRGSHGYVDVGGRYITAMSYYNPCWDAGTTCTRIAAFSNLNRTWGGNPLSSSRSENNTRVIRLIAPRVAKYVR